MRFLLRTTAASLIVLGAWLFVQGSTRVIAEEEKSSLFADPRLEAVVRQEALKHEKPDKPLTEEDLRKVYFLDASGQGIENLSGLERCPNLAQVNLAKNHVRDLGPLADHPLLQWLDLSHNAVEDISPLATLKGLQYLNLEANAVANLEPLAGLEKLSALYAAENKVEDVSPLSGLSKLASLDLSKNAVRDIGPLKGLVNLSLLNLNDNQIEDLRPLATPVSVRMLLLERNKITDLAPLVEAVRKDAEGPRRFAPYLNLYLAGNPLSDTAKGEQIDALKAAGVRVKSL